MGEGREPRFVLSLLLPGGCPFPTLSSEASEEPEEGMLPLPRSNLVSKMSYKSSERAAALNASSSYCHAFAHQCVLSWEKLLVRGLRMNLFQAPF